MLLPWTGCKCNSYIRDDILRVLIGGGVLPAQEVSYSIWYSFPFWSPFLIQLAAYLWYISFDDHKKLIFFLLPMWIPFAALYLTSVSVLAGFWGQCLVRKVVTILKRASIIVFILSGVIFASAITMGKTNFFFRPEIMFPVTRKRSFIIRVLVSYFWGFFFSGVIGIETSIQMIQNQEFMGFLDFCSSQWSLATIQNDSEKIKGSNKMQWESLQLEVCILWRSLGTVGQQLVDQPQSTSLC